MDKWSSLLVPHPNPHLFTGKKRLYEQSSSVSQQSSMSSLSDGTQKRRKLTKARQRSSPPPEIEPLSFEHEPMADMTTHIFGLFPPHSTSGVNDCTTLDGNLISQLKGMHIWPSLNNPATILIFSFTQIMHRVLTSRTRMSH
jgi:hypothetical protein